MVFFRAQDNLTNELQKALVQRLGQASGKPASSSLHIHPVLNSTSEFGVGDNEISHISSVARRKMFRHEDQPNKRRYDAARWHSDIQFERCPADYTSLRLTELPATGGDTLWASGYVRLLSLSRGSLPVSPQGLVVVDPSTDSRMIGALRPLLQAVPEILRGPYGDIRRRRIPAGGRAGSGERDHLRGAAGQPAERRA